MSADIENYKQRLFEAAAEYGTAGRSAYQELELHIDEALEHDRAPDDILEELGDPEMAVRKIFRADGKATYPLRKVFFSGVLIAIGLGLLFGVSGLLMPLGSRIGGMGSITGDPAVLPYTASRCEEYRQLVPAAHDCREAAMLHHYYELTDGRLILVIFTMLCLLLFWWAYKKHLIEVLPRKLLLLVAAAVYLAVGGAIMAVALGNLSAGREWEWLGDLLTGVPMAGAGVLLLAYCLGYISKPRYIKRHGA